jgi:hypothetical protein
MNFFSRISHQLTTGRQSSVHGFTPGPDLITPKLAAAHLLKLKLVQRGWYLDMEQEELYHFLPSAYLYAHMENPDKIYMMPIDECAKLSHLIDKFGMEGLTAWMRSSMKVELDDNMITLVRYQRAIAYLKLYPQLLGRLQYIDAEPADVADNSTPSSYYPGRLVDDAVLDSIITVLDNSPVLLNDANVGDLLAIVMEVQHYRILKKIYPDQEAGLRSS